MAVKDAVYLVDNGSGFDEIHFKTKAAQVVCSSGKDVQQEINERLISSEGIWTPIPYNGTNGYQPAYRDNGSYWVRNGSIVTCYFDFTVTDYDNSWEGASILIKGLPFTPRLNKPITGVASNYDGLKLNGAFGVSIYPHASSPVMWLGRKESNTTYTMLSFITNCEKTFRINGEFTFSI